MVAKLALHWQGTANWMRRVEFSAPFVKVCNPPEDNIFPDKMTIGRVFMKDGEEGSFYTRGRLGGQAYFERCMGWYKRAPYIHAWESWNEPAVIHTPGERESLDEATAEWCRLMHACGLKCVVGNFSERNPADGTIAEFVRMLTTGDYLGLHMYGAPSMFDEPETHVFRYRQLVAEIEAASLRVPPVLVGECGIDLGIIGRGRKGWQRAPGIDWGDYATQLRWYNRALCRDDYVAGGFVFSAATTREWQTFNITEKQARELARDLA